MKNLQQIQSKNNQLSMLQVAEIQVSYYPHFKANERLKLTSSKSVFDVLLNHWNPGAIQMKEEFKIVLLNRNNRVLGIFTVSSGGTAGTIVDLKILFSTALKACASGIILAHNHPSGNLTPSQQDLAVTKKVVEAGKMLDISILDHVIVTNEGYYSFADEGLL